MKKIAVVTATRAEYGLLEPVIKELRKYESKSITIELIVTGTHLSADYGMTINEIYDAGVRVDKKIVIPTKSDSAIDISENQAKTLVQFTRVFISEKYDAVVILGDRYEMLAIAVAAGNTKTPLMHLCGGDTTEGAMDEWIRHSITKISYLHFVTNIDSLNRVIQLGEDPSRVFNYGSTSIDNILSMEKMSKEDALSSVGLANCKYVICTYHPVTMDDVSVERQIFDFLSAIVHYRQLHFIVTKSNADQGGRRINELLDAASEKIDNISVYTSLGIRRYLSLMKYAECVLGNSSSGIIEAPAFGVPTVNIGDRQKGRLQSDSIINCDTDAEAIIEAIDIALSPNFRRICEDVVSPYGDGHAAERIASKIVECVQDGNIDLKKSFYEYRG